MVSTALMGFLMGRLDFSSLEDCLLSPPGYDVYWNGQNLGVYTTSSTIDFTADPYKTSSTVSSWEEFYK